MKKVVDYAIIGGGCAGLSLAYRLAKTQPSCSIAILEAQPAFNPKQTWCYWNVFSHPFEPCVSHRWSQWQVQVGQNNYLAHSKHYTYHHLPSLAFYSFVQAELQKHPSIKIYMDTTVKNIEEKEHTVHIQTTKGPIESRLVFDSRPLPVHRASFWQHFHGWTIQTEKALFTPDTMTLMDFKPCQTGVHFFYILPFSTHEALIESTYFSGILLPLEHYEKDIQTYLAAHYGSLNYQVKRREEGILPMQIQPTLKHKKSTRIMPIGIRAGWIKPSTGYAFLTIQKALEQLVPLLDPAKPVPFIQLQKKSWSFLDRLFLSFIKKHNEKAPELFGQLFKHVPPDTMVRFLGEQASLLEILKVARCSPKRLMLKEIYYLLEETSSSPVDSSGY